MHFRWKLMCLIASCSLLSTGLALAVVYWQFHDMLYNEIRSKAKAVAATTAVFLDGDDHLKIMELDTEAAMKTEEYAQAVQTLRKVRDANKAAGLKLEFVYSMAHADRSHKSDSNEAPGGIVFVADSTDPQDKKKFSKVHDPYLGVSADKIRIAEYDADHDFSEDQWGVWLSGWAPIHTKNGEVVAAAGVDIPAGDVRKELAHVRNIGLIGLAISVVMSVGVAFVISTQVNRPLLRLQSAVETIGRGDLKTRTTFPRQDEFGQVGTAINRMADELTQQELLRTAFARYVSKQVMDYVLRSGALPDVKGERRRITVLFSDIRGFTTLSENMRAEDVVQLLNEYFERMIDVVFRHQGTLDKFIGDGMMVVFGAPFDDPYQEEHAVQAALEMQRELETLCARWELEGRQKIQIGIGISSGPAVVGNVGSHQRMEYTAIGDTVNLASRIESATKEHGVNLLISEHTYLAIKGTIPAVRVGEIPIRGRGDTVTIYGVQAAS